jgi:hypothetical protein
MALGLAPAVDTTAATLAQLNRAEVDARGRSSGAASSRALTRALRR